jgi:hypothetical protein
MNKNESWRKRLSKVGKQKENKFNKLYIVNEKEKNV